MICKRAIRTGDGTHHAAIEAKKKNMLIPDNNNEGEQRDLDHFWGWGKSWISKADVHELFMKLLKLVSLTYTRCLKAYESFKLFFSLKLIIFNVLI